MFIPLLYKKWFCVNTYLYVKYSVIEREWAQLLVCCESHSVMSSFLRPNGLLSHQTPLSMGFPRQEYWSGLPCPLPGDLPDPGIELGLLHCRQILYCLSHEGNPLVCHGGFLQTIIKPSLSFLIVSVLKYTSGRVDALLFT